MCISYIQPQNCMTFFLSCQIVCDVHIKMEPHFGIIKRAQYEGYSLPWHDALYSYRHAPRDLSNSCLPFCGAHSNPFMTSILLAGICVHRNYGWFKGLPKSNRPFAVCISIKSHMHYVSRYPLRECMRGCGNCSMHKSVLKDSVTQNTYVMFISNLVTLDPMLATNEDSFMQSLSEGWTLLTWMRPYWSIPSHKASITLISNLVAQNDAGLFHTHPCWWIVGPKSSHQNMTKPAKH